MEPQEAPTSLSTTPPTVDLMRPLRYAVRVPLLLLHLGIGLPITLILINPVSARTLIKGERLDHLAIRWWSALLMRVFGFSLHRVGTPHAGACLTVANHVSWLDIELVHSQRVVHFVAKSEISRWPLVGWLASRAGTIYHKRGSQESLGSVAQIMVDRLREGHAVGVFPEGGTTDGLSVKTFHARIFQAALDAGVPAQPVALRYLHDGAFNTRVPFKDSENFLQNFLRLLGERRSRAEVHFLPIIQDSGAGRRQMAENARQSITQTLG
jgi:1-acyl-sn-glycerol-3-phosphate acyltransferase